jgi:glutathione synthase/RimK-type ligase-like ATP-grasp enzyme
VPHIALLTLANASKFIMDDALAIAEFRRRGWEASEVPWTARDIDWSALDAVIVRTTWDYHLQPDRFVATLESIAARAPRFANDLPLIRWNIDKRYLRKLAECGVPIVPSMWGEGGHAATFAQLFDELQTDEIVVKPTVGANAMDAFRLRSPMEPALAAQLVTTYANRTWFAQPFLHQITTDGEYSVFFFNGRYSHCIRKLPTAGDFRVQEEHGGRIAPATAPSDMLDAAHLAMRTVVPSPLQARVDLVRLDDGTPAVMELELIEPALYLRTDSQAPARFVDAVEEWVRAAIR